MEATHLTQGTLNMFCHDKLEMKEIKVKYDNFGNPDVCLIASREDKYYLLVYLDPVDYYPYFCKKILIENTEPVDTDYEKTLIEFLKPCILNQNESCISISLKGKQYTVKKK